MPVRAAKLPIKMYTWWGACHRGSRKWTSNHSMALERPKQSASCCTTPVPRHQKLVNVRREPSTWWIRAAPAPPTRRPLYRPLEETVAATVRMAMPGCRRRESRSSTHSRLSCGAHRPMWFRHSPHPPRLFRGHSVRRPSPPGLSKGGGPFCSRQFSPNSSPGRPS